MPGEEGRANPAVRTELGQLTAPAQPRTARRKILSPRYYATGIATPCTIPFDLFFLGIS